MALRRVPIGFGTFEPEQYGHPLTLRVTAPFPCMPVRVLIASPFFDLLGPVSLEADGEPRTLKRSDEGYYYDVAPGPLAREFALTFSPMDKGGAALVALADLPEREAPPAHATAAENRPDASPDEPGDSRPDPPPCTPPGSS